MKYRLIILIGIGLIVVVAIAALIWGRKAEDPIVGEVVMWGIEDREAWREVINGFETVHPGATIVYEERPQATYEQDLLNALAAGRGPDLFEIHRSWVDKHRDKIMPFSSEVIDTAIFGSTFVDVATTDFVRNNSVYALPLFIDTLALYYNRNLFNSAGVIDPPRTWESFLSVVESATERTANDDIAIAGATIGTSNNIAHAADILAALMMQSGAQMVSARGDAAFDQQVNTSGQAVNPGEQALAFYTDFSSPPRAVYTYNTRLPDALDQFTRGRAAIYFGYARELSTIRASGISFSLSEFPQIVDRSEDPGYLDLSYADYWGVAISRNARNLQTTQEFALFATSRNASFQYLNRVQLPAARRDLIDVQLRDTTFAPFARQSLTASSWPQGDAAETRVVFNSMIESVVLGRSSVREAVTTGADQVTNILRKYLQ